MKTLTFFLLFILSFNCSAAGSYGYSLYNVIIEDAAGNPLSNTFLDYSIDGQEMEQTKTDKVGKITIPINYGTECMDSEGPLKRIYSRNSLKYYAKTITIHYLGSKGTIKKNWKKHFKGVNTHTDRFCYETGRLNT